MRIIIQLRWGLKQSPPYIYAVSGAPEDNIMGKRNKVTTRDIAEYAGVSQSTVSMILSEKKNVSFGEDTIKKVRSAASALGYRKPAGKKKMPDRSLSQTIMILCPTISNGYYHSVVQAIIERAQEYGYTVLTAVTLRQSENENAYFRLFEENELTGVISLYPLTRYTEANALAKRVPVVSIGEKPEGIKFDSIELDSLKPGILMARHLAELGHRRIAFLSAPVVKKEISRTRRLEGLRSGFREMGLDPSAIELYCPSQKIYAGYPTTGAEYKTGYEMTLRALNAGTKATAFIGNSDDIAFGILAAMAEQDFSVPGDFSVAGFDNNLYSSMPQISLTTVEHSAVSKGQRAVDLLHQKNKSREKTAEGNYIMRMEYEPELIVRSTTGPVRQ